MRRLIFLLTFLAIESCSAQEVFLAFIDTSIKACDIQYTNEYGARITKGLQVNSNHLCSFPLRRFSIVNVTTDARKPVQVFCYPGDTVYLNHAGYSKWKYVKREFKYYDTTFSRYTLLQHKKYYDTLAKYDSMNRGERIGTGNLYRLKTDLKNKDSFYSNYYKVSNALCESELNALDSLLTAGKINRDCYLMYGSIAAAKCLGAQLRCYQQTKHAFFLQSLIGNRYLNDKYLEYDIEFFKQVVNSYIWTVCGRNTEMRKVQNGIYLDYGKLYDSVSLYFTGNILSYAKYYCLSHIRTEETREKATVYFEKFKSEVREPALVAYVNSLFTDVDLASVADGKAIDEYNADLNLNEFIAKNKGKYLLIDLWASWCVPCIRSIRESKSMYGRLNKNEVTLLFLSLDEDLLYWKRAMAKEELTKYGFSFCVSDPRNNGFIKKMNITTIPRCLLIGPDGKVQYADFPIRDKQKSMAILKEKKLL